MAQKPSTAVEEGSPLRFLEEYRVRCLPELEDALRAKVPAGESLVKEAVLYFLRAPGKRLRGLLTLLSCEVAGGRYQEALEAACAVELIHASSLILDDLPCMDNADARRGQPSLHKPFGEAVAILTAIFFLNKAFQTVHPYKECAARMLESMHACIGEDGMIQGQLMDVLGRSNDYVTRELKTGSLMKLAVKLGASVAGSERACEDALVAYAENLGVVFQMQDDFLDGEDHGAATEEKALLAAKTAQSLLIKFGETNPARALAGMVIYASNRNC